MNYREEVIFIRLVKSDNTTIFEKFFNTELKWKWKETRRYLI